MALEIFKLVGSIYVDNEKANDSIKKTDDKASNLGENLKSGIKTAGKWGAAIAAGAAVAVSGAVELAKKTAETADNIDKMSQKLGLSTEAYQEWDYVMSQSGVDIDSLQGGVKTLTNAFADATAGNEKAIEKFEAIGLAIEDLEGMSREDLFDATITALQGMEDNADRAAAANDLLGKSSSNMTPLLNQSADATQELKDRAHELGMVMSEDAVAQGVTLTDTLDTLQKSFEGVVAELGVSVIPLVQELAEIIIDNMPFIRSVFDQLSPVIVDMLDQLLPILTDLITDLLPVAVDIINSLLPLLSEICLALFPIAVDLIKLLVPPLLQIIQAILPVAVTIIKQLSPLLEPILLLLEPILQIAIALLTPLLELVNVLLPIVVEYITLITGIVADLLNSALKVILNYINDYVVPAIKKLTDKISSFKSTLLQLKSNILTVFENIKTGVGKSIDNLKEKFKTGFNDMKNAVKTPINAIIGFVNKLINGLNKIKVDIPSWVPGEYGGKTFGIDIPNIPKLEKGGTVDGAGTVLVGERGPELLNLPAGASVHPLNGQSSAFDYDQMQKAFIAALQTIVPYLDKQLVPDADKMFKIMQQKSNEYYEMTGRGGVYV